MAGKTVIPLTRAIPEHIRCGLRRCAIQIDVYSANAEISDRIELHWKCLYTPKRPGVTTGDSFWGRVALKLVVTTLVAYTVDKKKENS